MRNYRLILPRSSRCADGNCGEQQGTDNGFRAQHIVDRRSALLRGQISEGQALSIAWSGGLPPKTGKPNASMQLPNADKIAGRSRLQVV